MRNGASRWKMYASNPGCRRALAMLGMWMSVSGGCLLRTSHYALRFPAPAPGNDARTDFTSQEVDGAMEARDAFTERLLEEVLSGLVAQADYDLTQPGQSQ